MNIDNIHLTYYVVQTHMSYGWDNVWHTGDESDLTCFKCLKDAEGELHGFLYDMEKAFDNGDVDSPYLEEGYRIVKVTEEVMR
jgi:hypothetical protein